MLKKKIAASHVRSSFIVVYSRKTIPIPSNLSWLEPGVRVLIFIMCINGKSIYSVSVLWEDIYILTLLCITLSRHTYA